MNLISFSANSQIVTASGNIESACNGTLFINLGTDVCTVLSYPLQQGQQLNIPCNIGEIDNTKYNATFANVTTDRRLLVIRKNY
jgi:hypothetical protein